MTTPSQLLRLALPLIPQSGFTAKTLQAASVLLPNASQPCSYSTISALFPSPPPKQTKRSLTRQEIIDEAMCRAGHARGAGGSQRPEEERLGPAKALLEEWLREGRRVMSEHVKAGGFAGSKGVREGLRARVRYNEPVLDRLPEALALLGTSSLSPLSSLSALWPLPSPTGYLEHVARIAHDLAQATGDENQGVDWYASRGRIGTIYSMAELHLISPQLSSLSPSERTTSTLEFIDRLLEHFNTIETKTEDAKLFGDFVVRSWIGLGRAYL